MKTHNLLLALISVPFALNAMDTPTSESYREKDESLFKHYITLNTPLERANWLLEHYVKAVTMEKNDDEETYTANITDPFGHDRDSMIMKTVVYLKGPHLCFSTLEHAFKWWPPMCLYPAQYYFEKLKDLYLKLNASKSSK